MVTLTEVIASNKRIASSFPDGLVAVFVGGTSGVGEYTVKAFAKYVSKPRAYIVGRSEEAASRIIKQCQQMNSKGHFEFIQADISLLHTIDTVCDQIKSKEPAINILFQSQGSLGFTKTTSESLPLTSALALHGRTRFILNLLPLLRNAQHLRRVVSVAAASFEGPIDMSNVPGIGFSLYKWRDQFASCVTLLLGKVAQRGPDVAFVHTCPGVVKSGIMRDMEPTLRLMVAVAIARLLAPLVNMPPEECGERHLFVATSARYAAGEGKVKGLGVSLATPVMVARGVDGKVGSGVYSVDTKGDSASPRVEQLLKKFGENGTMDKVWEYVLSDFMNVTGFESH